ncbi:alpha/beta hydrolase [Actinoplanes aureus]|uniref:Alpha/beta hydrolase n=1 Tax=Actinoplanes aureus TaxID=2792083 RepID=A0A931CEM1_9ACTN|nr:alpha/beta hydrolase [Actinoplanes aureus]MBG0565851.1 alpha/beta hydrolase [Actinoplanes aureus]
MDAAFVLVHSPSVGPLTWQPVADRLTGSGRIAVVPSLLGVADAGPPFWPAVVEAVTAGAPADVPLVLVAHSNAGLFVPVVAEALRQPVAACVFVDAALPARTGPTPVLTPELLDVLRPTVAADGRLPQWTSWFGESEVAPMFPDRRTRQAVSAEQPRLPFGYYEQRVPVPAGWDGMPCGYLLFGPPYDKIAEDARQRGWDVDEVPGRHLHQIVDPGAVTGRIVAMADRLLS